NPRGGPGGGAAPRGGLQGLDAGWLGTRHLSVSGSAGWVRIEIPDPELCPRYSAALIRNVHIAPSPERMQRRLRLAGMRPINNIVDITNYVMLEWGQPLHAFDYDKLVRRAGDSSVPTIIIRRAHEGERMTTLDGV